MKLNLLIFFCLSCFKGFCQNDTSYYETGEIHKIYKFLNKQNNRLSIHYYKNGEVRYKVKSNNGITIGKTNYYHENGKIKSITYSKNNKSVRFNELGNVVSVQKIKKRKSSRTLFYDSGKKSDFHSIRGGRITCSYSKLTEEGEPIESSKKCKYGEIEVIQKDNKTFDLNGNRITFKYFSKSKKWYENGQLKEKITSRNGRLVEKNWTEKGVLICHDVYQFN